MRYNSIMNLLSVQGYVIGIIIAVVAVQYAFALFCLLKLAYMDFDKKQYILWNLFILIVFFIGGAVFLVYYKKHPEKKISLNDITATNAETSDEQQETSDMPDAANEPDAEEQTTDIKQSEE